MFVTLKSGSFDQDTNLQDIKNLSQDGLEADSVSRLNINGF